MSELINQYQEYLIWISIISLASLVVSIIALPYLIGLIPKDYFLNHYQAPQTSLLLKIMRNILGVILLIAGLIMLVAPGQGILTILFSLFLMNFPKKKKLEQFIIHNNKIFDGLNWLRNRYHHPAINRE